MHVRPLGSGGPDITTVGYGAWQAGGGSWGTPRSDAEVIAAIQAAIDAGMSWIDTAEVYGNGTSERLVGRAIAGRRDEALVFTKVAPSDEGSGIRPEQIGRAVRGSLKRLGIEQIDLYQVHWPDDGVPVEETWGAMAELVDQGLVARIGVSNFDRPLLERCLSIHPVASVQNELSLLHRDDVGELLPWLAEKKIGYLAYSPLGSGLLTGGLGRNPVFDAGDWRASEFSAETLAEAAAVVDAMRATSERAGIPVPALALAWVISRPGVTAAIAGSLNPANVAANARASDLDVSPDVLDELDQAASAA
ncbi:MAG TPA: aldo/keto reductase [Gaiellales bacterium]|jgi:aryl-alcohol dehydrogenase-like predicted oxidoreductase|nr:aldo/keto reductase [Gaiellales bacterium]